MKPATEILLSAAFALTPEENWTQGYFARSVIGSGVKARSPRAACFCVLGALHEAARAIDPNGYMDARETVAKIIPAMTVAGFNDTSTHKQVLAALYRAAELSESA